jgi:hypothetical protein
MPGTSRDGSPVTLQPPGQELPKVEHFRSRERVREQGEVFTQDREIQAMLDLMPGAFEKLDTTFLEPAAGNGNFLVHIFRRKVELISESSHGGTQRWFEFAALRALSSIFAVDIDPRNIDQARQRMLDEMRSLSVDGDCLEAAQVILQSTVVTGDTLSAPQSIQFIRYQAQPVERFKRTIEFLEQPEMHLFYEPPGDLADVHFSELKSAVTQ